MVGKAGVIAGLSWMPIDAHKREESVRWRAREMEAKKVITLSQGDSWVVGLGEIDDLDNTKPPRTAHSLAAVLWAYINANFESPESTNLVAAFQVELGDGEIRREMVALVVLDSGLPVIDYLKPVGEAQSIAGEFLSGSKGFSNYRLITNDLAAFPAGDAVDLADLVSYADKSTFLRSPPADIKRNALVAAVALGVLGGGHWYMDVYKPEQQRQEMLRKAAAENPLPKYMAALEARIGALGVTRTGMTGLLRRLESYPAWVNGWALEMVHCANAVCTTSWARRGGTIDDLTRGRPGEALSYEGFDRATLQFAADMPMAGLSSKDQAPQEQEAMRSSTAVYQSWTTAGIRVSVAGTGYAVWPDGDGAYEPSSVPVEVALKRQPVEVTLPMTLAEEALLRAPDDVWWESLTLKINLASSTEVVLADLKGASYVRH
jgi:hypothetical protein